MKYLIFLITILFFMACGGSSYSKSSRGLQQSLSAGNTQNWYTPPLNTSWQIQLSGTLNINHPAELYIVDLFDTNQSTIDALHIQGKKVICYFSAGSYENWREDKSDFDPSIIGNDLNGWAGEKWLNISSELLRPIMKARLDRAFDMRCDGVDPDNVDGYTHNTGFALSASEQISYNTFLANEAHLRGLSIGLKNNLNQVQELVELYDFAINEQCNIYNECDLLSPFIDKNKPVFNIEYDVNYVNNTNSATDTLCAESHARQFKTLILPLLLDDTFRTACN